MGGIGSGWDASALWVPVVLAAALAQTGRNAAQRALTGRLGTWAATLVRFLYGLPFAAAFVVLQYALPAWRGGAVPALPHFSVAYLGWIAAGAAFQVAATGVLLMAMQARNFAVAVTLSKTEVLQVALLGVLLLAEWPTPWALAAMALASAGVALLAWPPGGVGARGGFSTSSALLGLSCGACFALSTVAFRGAALALGESSAWRSGGWGVLLAQAMQSVVLGAWLARRSPEGLAPVWRAWRGSLLAGSLGAGASLLWFSAYAMQAAAPVRTLGMVEVLFSLAVSRRVFHERLRGTEWLGIGAVLGGLVMIGLAA